MPTQTAAARAALVTIADFEKGAQDSESDPFVEQKWMRANGIPKTNKTGITDDWKAMTARGTVDAMTRDATSTFSVVNPGVNLSLANAGYKTSEVIHETDIAENSGSKQQIIDMLQNRLEWMPEAIHRARASDFYGYGIAQGQTNGSSFGTNPIIGLRGAIITSGTYAGQNVATETALKGQVLSGGVHQSFSIEPFQSLTQAILACYRGTDVGMGQYEPDGIFTGVTNFGYLLNASNEPRRDVSSADTLKTGKTNLVFMGIPIFMSRFCPDKMYFVLNSKFIQDRTPFDNHIQARSKKEVSPLVMNLLCFYYGHLRVTLPRAHAFVTTD